MRILFFNPSNGVSYNENPPLGLLYLASVARQEGCEVDLYDQAAPENKLSYSIDYVKNFTPDICAFSIFTFNINTTFSFMKEIKKELPNCLILGGGHHATALPEKTMEQCKEIDYLFIGEGELTLKEFLVNLKQNKPMREVKGILFRENGKLINTGRRDFVKNLDELPFPAHDLIQKYNYESEGIGKGRKIANISGSRGCPFHCAYCNKAVFASVYRRRSPKMIVSEIKFIFENFGYDEVFFHDELFTGNKKWLEEFYHELDAQNLHFPWRCLGRVGTVDRNTLRKMKKYGCYIIAFGIESGNPEVRRKISRPMSDEDIIQTFKDARKAGLLTYAFNIIGHQPDTHDTVRDTYNLMVKTSPHFAPVFICCPLPGSPIYDLVPQEIKYDWEKFNSYRDFSHLPISISSVSPRDLVAYADQMEVLFISRIDWFLKNVLFSPYPLRAKKRFLNVWIWSTKNAKNYLSSPNNFITKKRGLYRLKLKAILALVGLIKLSLSFIKFFALTAIFALSVPLSLALYVAVFIRDTLVNHDSTKAMQEKDSGIPDNNKASIVIVNWNGKELLEECLPSVIAAVEYDNQNHEIIVVDNGSADGSISFVRNQFPQIKVIALDKNYGFGEGNNIGVKAATNDIVVLLNNDMVVNKDFLRPLLNGFKDTDVFAVSSQIFLQHSHEKRVETGKTSARFRLGAIEYSHDSVPATLSKGYYPIYWAGGGSSAFDRRKFLALGGFDNLFSPCYGEDTNISHLAWKHGWRILFAPESKVYHKHRASSIKRFGESYIDVIVKKNMYLLIWKNITDHSLLLSHFLFLPARLAYFTFKSRGFSALRSFILALGQFPKALARRDAKSCVSTDRNVLDVSTNISSYREKYLPKKKHEKGARLNILLITAYLPHVGIHAGGGRMFKVIEILARRHDITLISFLESEAEKEYIPEIEKHCVLVKTILRKPTPRKNIINLVPQVVNEFWSKDMNRLIQETMAETDFDVIQLEYTQMAQYVPESKRAYKILTEHEVTFANYYKLSMFYEWMRTLKWEVDICSKFDKIICMTHEDAAELNGYLFEDKAEVINTGVDASFFSSNETLEEPDTLIFVGSFRHSPNVDGIIYFSNEVLPLIKKNVPDVKLYIVGSNPPPEIKNLARTPSIIVTGFVEDLRPYLEKSSVYVVPLRLGCGIRGKILEAWAMEKAVVATPLACAGLDAINMENVLISETPEHFANETVRLLKDPQLRKRLGKNGKNTVERKYDWEIIGKKMLEMYDNIGYGL